MRAFEGILLICLVLLSGVLAALELTGEEHNVNFFRSLVSYTGFSGNYAGNAIMSMESLSKASGSLYSVNVGYYSAGEVSEVFRILSSVLRDYALILNENQGIYLTASGEESLWVSVIKPDSSQVNISLVDGVWKNFSDTNLVGRYNVSFYINDSSGNLEMSEDYFEVFEPINFNFSVVDSLGEDTSFEWRVYYRDDLLNESSDSGNAIIELPSTELDLDIRGYSGGIGVYFEDVSLSMDNNEEIVLDRLSVPVFGQIVTYGVNSTYDFSFANVSLNYSEFGLSSSEEDRLSFYKCDNWNVANRYCDGVWVNVTNESIKDEVNDLMSLRVSSFSGLGISEVGHVCGDRVCGLGEDCSSCSRDCRACSEGFIGEVGGGGGSSGCGIGYKRINGTCVEIVKEFREVDEIPEKLFLIKFDLSEKTLKVSSELEAVISFESSSKVPTFVNLTYRIYDSQDNLVYEELGGIIVTNKEVLRKSFSNLDLSDGEYKFVLITVYDDVYDEFSKDFRVLERRGITGRVVGLVESKGKWWLSGAIILLLIMWLVWWFVFGEKRKKEKDLKRRVKVYEKSLFTKEKSIIVVKKKSKKKWLKSILKERKKIEKNEKELKSRKSKLRLKEINLKRINSRLRKLMIFGFGLQKKREGVSRKISGVEDRIDKLERKKERVVKK